MGRGQGPAADRIVRRLAVAALLAWGTAAAQTPDSVTVAVRDARPLTADSLTAPALPRPSVAPAAAARGRWLAPVPAATNALTVEALFGDARRRAAALPSEAAVPLPSAFVYTLAAPGRAGGVAWDGLDPARPALALDGRPFLDLFTGAPRYDLLPAEALGETVGADTRWGRPMGVEATVRTFRLARPVTELRYHTGREGIQAASGTHAQTRRAPGFLSGGSPDARLTASLHVATRNATGPLAGGQLRHADAVGRLLLTRPGLALDAGALYADRTDGARRGAVASSFSGLFTGSAQPRDPSATRRTRRTEAWATARVRLLPEPTTVTASVARQRLVYSPAPTDTLETWAAAATLALTQGLAAGGPTLRLTATREGDPTGGTDPLGDPGARLQLHAEALDTLDVGRLRLAVAAGGHAVGGHAFPSGSVRAALGRLLAGVRLAGTVPGRVEATGLADRILAGGEARETTLLAELSAWTRPGTLSVGARAVAHRRWNATLLAARGDSLFAWETAPAPLDYAALTLAARWRDARPRGVYALAEATAGGSLASPTSGLSGGASALARREADALPRLHGTLRVGTRATGVGGVVDLDLAATARAWSAFRSRVVEPATGLLALPERGTPLGYVVPARGVVSLAATATFSARASVYLGLDHALGRLAPALVVPGEPLPAGVVRFGVFWALLD